MSAAEVVSGANEATVIFFAAACTAVVVAVFSHTPRAWCVAAAIIAAIGGMHTMWTARAEVDAWHRRAGEHVTREVVVREVRTMSYDARVTAQISGGRERILWRDVKYPAVAPGDRVMVTCTLRPPPTDFLRTFPMMMARRRVMMFCDNPRVVPLGRAVDALTIAADVRARLVAPITTMIAAPYAGLAAGLIFGGDGLLSRSVQDAFARTGMTHIVAVSGYNVSVIVAAVVGGLIFLGLHRARATIFAIVAIAAFVALIGFPASGVRAALMGVLVLLAASYGRIAHAQGALALAGVAMVAHNPFVLLYDIGFQLSFLATYGIISVVPLMERMSHRVPRAFGVREIIAVTTAAQIFVVPVILYHFHTISFVSLAVNIAVLPVIPVAMLLTLMVIVAAFVAPPLAEVCAWVAYVPLAYVIGAVEYAARLPWASLEVEHVSVAAIVVYYVGILAVCGFLRKKYLVTTSL